MAVDNLPGGRRVNNKIKISKKQTYDYSKKIRSKN